MNKPLRKETVENLPIGFNITGFYPNRKMRRDMLQPNYSTKGVQNVLQGVDEGGFPVIPMWIKKSGKWILNPIIVSFKHVRTLKHVN